MIRYGTNFSSKYIYKVKVAITNCNVLLRSEAFKDYVCDLLGKDYIFEFSKDTVNFDGINVKEVFDIIEWYNKEGYPDITVNGYTCAWYSFFQKRVYAYVSASNQTVIHLHNRHLYRSVQNVSGTLFHEMLHLIDYKHPFGIGHGNNSSKGKENSVPYKMGNLVSKFLTKSII